MRAVTRPKMLEKARLGHNAIEGTTTVGAAGRAMSAQRWRAFLWATMLALVLILAWGARAALIPFAVGALLAYTLTPAVDLVSWLIPGRLFAVSGSGRHQLDVFRRGVAVLVVYAAIGTGLFAIGSVIIPIATDQTVEFVNDLPEVIEDAREQTSDWLTQYRERVPEDVQQRIDGYAEDAGGVLADRVAAIGRRSVDMLTGTIVVLFGFVIVPFWMFFALRDRHNVARNFMNGVPEPLRDDVSNLLAIADRLLLRYIRAQLFLGVLVGTAVGMGLTMMDVKFSLALGVIAGITEMIPIIGPWIGGVPGMLIVASTDPDLLLWVGLLYLGVQMVENNLLVPRVQGHAVDLHPAMVILLLVVSGAAFGLFGLIVVVPLTAILRELFWYADRRLSGVSASEAFALTMVARERRASRPLLLRLARRLRRLLPQSNRGTSESARGAADGTTESGGSSE